MRDMNWRALATDLERGLAVVLAAHFKERV
jgi:hypothetical protein